jgi:hypothetical protein
MTLHDQALDVLNTDKTQRWTKSQIQAMIANCVRADSPNASGMVQYLATASLLTDVLSERIDFDGMSMRAWVCPQRGPFAYYKHISCLTVKERKNLSRYHKTTAKQHVKLAAYYEFSANWLRDHGLETIDDEAPIIKDYLER